MSKRRIPKPYSEMTREDKIIEARGAIERLSHPHNRGLPEAHSAIRRWQEALAQLEKEK